jgi:hypothetical protein
MRRDFLEPHAGEATPAQGETAAVVKAARSG